MFIVISDVTYSQNDRIWEGTEVVLISKLKNRNEYWTKINLSRFKCGFSLAGRLPSRGRANLAVFSFQSTFSTKKKQWKTMFLNGQKSKEKLRNKRRTTRLERGKFIFIYYPFVLF